MDGDMLEPGHVLYWQAVIDNINYVSGTDLDEGKLVIQVPTSAYNDSSLRDAMINSIYLSL
jgi:hypothetical protein